MITPTRLPGIGARAWEHPADRAALDVARRIPLVADLLRETVGRASDAIWGLRLSDTRPAAPDHYPDAYYAWAQVLDTMDSPIRPKLLIAESEFINAATSGVREPFVMLTSTAAGHMNAEQLKVVLAHELGHVLSGHVTYKALLRMLFSMGSAAFRHPVSGVALVGILLAFVEWDRKSELSADRASLMAVQDVDLVVSTLAMAHGNKPPDSPPGWIAHFQRIRKRLQTHPSFEERESELRAFAASDTYRSALRGSYPRRDDTSGLDWAERYELLQGGLKSFFARA